PEKEIWNGYRYGPKGAVSEFLLDDAYDLDQLNAKMVELLAGCQRIYYPLRDLDLGKRIDDWRQRIKGKARSSIPVPDMLQDLDPLLHEMRLFKCPQEQAMMRSAGELSAAGHIAAMQSCKPGLMEYQLEATILHCFAQQGARWPAYNTIVGGGANGCILHYTENRDALADGDLVLIDAGAEVDGYAGDITRTFPVNGQFGQDQRLLYQLVLDAQLAAIEAIKPGANWNDPHLQAVRVLTEGLLELGLLSGELQQLIDDEAYRTFYMHRTGHWLGLDVHDVGEYKQQDDWRPLLPGMVLTVEPGLYIAPDCQEVDERWRGIGIRIEDDVLVTEQGCEILTAAVPKAIDEIEALMASAKEQE
ncbi:MAG: aminopeptidase P N-terminal domain-containing protein, partial [Motiliproteus sp.]|nr:aminopeptidase P N-terminal domain-containing protein [Motiliproteus sp.]